MEINILLVEDDEGEAHHIEKLLSQADTAFSVVHVVSLRAALQVLAVRDNIDIALLDLSLPDSHGFETVTAFARGTDVPFIVLTGNDDIDMAMRSTRLGAQDYQLKADIKAASLERAVCMAVDKAANERARTRRSYETMNQLLPADQATAVMLIPRVRHLIAAWEEMETYLRNNAPGLMDDVGALMDKHRVSETIREVRNVVGERNAPAGRHRRRSISDSAFRALESVAERRPSKAPRSWEEAEAAFDVVAAKGTGT